MTTILKDVNDITNATITWTLDTGETISTSVWAAETGLTVDSDTTTTTTTTVWISGGTANHTYKLYNTITTSTGRTLRRYVLIQVGEVAA